MHATPRSLAALLLAVLASSLALPAAAASNPMRDKVRAVELAHAERVLGAAEVERLLATNPEIIGGTVAPANKWKAQVALLNAAVADNFNAQFCGGSRIGNQHILTAAHCIEGIISNASELEILTGTQSLTSGGTRRKVQWIKVHPNFDDTNFDYDVAVVKLKAPVTGLTVNQLVTKSNETALASPGTQSYVTGWGNTGPSPVVWPTELNEVQVPLVSRFNCNKPASYNGDVTPRMICAGLKAGGKDSCQGDSGGPLVVRNGAGKWRTQAGVVSWGIGCALPDRYGVYTRIAVVNGWIKKQLAR